MSESASVHPMMERRRLLASVAGGTVLSVLGGLYVLLDHHPAYGQTRADGRPRIPPGQRVLEELRDMGGREGNPKTSELRLRVHGEVDTPLVLDFRELMALPQTTERADVHCVTGWSVLDTEWSGVRVRDLAERAGVKKGARYVVFEAAHGYTANLPLGRALADNALVAHRMNGKRLARPHGAPVRSLVPDLYFWKSAKWLEGIRFVARDEPGYWERRGYHNQGDPWKEERYG